jgi:hypothetical protein
MSESTPHQPIADPASQHTDDEDTSIVPDLTADPVEEEEARTAGLGEDQP